MCAITVHTTSQMQQVHIGMLDEVMANWHVLFIYFIFTHDLNRNKLHIETWFTGN